MLGGVIEVGGGANSQPGRVLSGGTLGADWFSAAEICRFQAVNGGGVFCPAFDNGEGLLPTMYNSERPVVDRL